MLKNRNFVYGSLVIILFAINYYIYRNFHNGWIYTDLRTYQELYNNNDRPYINNIERTKLDSVIELSIAPQDNKVSISLNYGINDYQFDFDDSKKSSKKITIGLTPLDLYIKSGNREHSVSPVNVYESELPIAHTLPYSTKDWTTPLSYFSGSDIQSVKSILEKEIKIVESEHSIEKIKKICLFLTQKLEKGKGTQKSNGNPYLQYSLAVTGQDKIWCTGYADIYHLFATIANIPTRKVGFSSRFNSVYLAAHATAESYIEEKNQWVFIDLITSVIMPFSAQDRHLINAAELYNLLKYNTTSHIKIHTYQQAKLDSVLLDSSTVRTTLKHFLSKDANINYRLPVTDDNYYTKIGKAKRYLGLVRVRVTYSDSTIQKNNWKHYLKVILVILNIIFSILLTMRFVSLFNHKTQS